MDTDAVSNSPEKLLQAFVATDYRVRVDGHEHVVRIGRSLRGLDAAVGNRPWAIITACNPQALPLDRVDNRTRHRKLLGIVTELKLASHPAVNRDPGEDWPDETALLIVDADEHILDALAEKFGQAAIVTGGNGRPASLRLYGRGWPDALPEWAGRARR